MSARARELLYLLFALLVASYFAYLTFDYTTDTAIIKDARQNVVAAYHLAHTGVMGRDKTETDNPRPQMRREPLPIVVTAVFLLLHPDFQKAYTIAELTGGPLAETVKGVNAVWRFLAAVFLFLLCRELFPDRRVAAAMALICLIASEPLFFAQPSIVDRLYTELPEVALLLLASWSAIRFTRAKTKSYALWLGVVLGALALTKVAFLYIGIGFIILLFVADRLTVSRTDLQKGSLKSLLATYAVLALAMLATVAPWLVRNAIEFGKPQIAAGGESVLAIRVLLTEQPLLGGIYIASSPGLRTRVVGPLTGYSPDDLTPGGRLEELASVKEKRWEILKQRMEAEGFDGDQNEWLKRMALDYAIQNPLRYIASIGVFAYKGMWFMKGPTLFTATALLCFFGVFFGGLFAGNRVLVAAFGLPAGLFFFISVFTHALTRYNAPITPFVILSVLWLLAAFSRGALRSPGLSSFFGRNPPACSVAAERGEEFKPAAPN